MATRAIIVGDTVQTDGKSCGTITELKCGHFAGAILYTSVTSFVETHVYE